MKDFIFQHWPSILAVIIALINVLITLLKKKVKVIDGVWSKVLEMLPELICNVETCYRSGPEKKALVCNYVVDYLCKAYDLSRKEVEVRYGFKLSEAVESILACPQKKGGSTDEK